MEDYYLDGEKYEVPEGCIDLTGIDFGECDKLGIGWVNNSCENINLAVIGLYSVDHTGAFFSMDSCQQTCMVL